MIDCELYGLVLTGGFSKRMNRDKANLIYPFHGKPQWEVTAEYIRPFCKEVFLSIREGQHLDGLGDGSSETLVDRGLSQGPFSGFLSAMERVPGQALLVVACDLPLLDESILRTMIEHRGAAVLGVRPESIGFEPEATGKGPLVEIDAVERYGDRGDAWLRLVEGGDQERLVHRGAAVDLPAEGFRVRFGVLEEGIHVFEPGSNGRRLGPDIG